MKENFLDRWHDELLLRFLDWARKQGAAEQQIENSWKGNKRGLVD